MTKGQSIDEAKLTKDGSPKKCNTCSARRTRKLARCECSLEISLNCFRSLAFGLLLGLDVSLGPEALLMTTDREHPATGLVWRAYDVIGALTRDYGITFAVVDHDRRISTQRLRAASTTCLLCASLDRFCAITFGTNAAATDAAAVSAI
jgi:hypothetical protein